MLDTINAFRKRYSKSNVIVDNKKNEWCTAHCWEMVRQENVFHSIPQYHEGWGEIVAYCEECGSWNYIENLLINMIDNSQAHRDILIESDVIGYGIVCFKHKIYLTIRGKKL